MGIQYILINLRSGTERGDCMFCRQPLGQSYVWDPTTDLRYHNPYCFQCHVMESVKAIGGDNGKEMSAV